MGTEMDNLVIGNCFLEKTKLSHNLKIKIKDKFELD